VFISSFAPVALFLEWLAKYRRRQRKPTKEKSVELNEIPAVSLKLNFINDRELNFTSFVGFQKKLVIGFFRIDVHHSIIWSIAVAHFHICEA